MRLADFDKSQSELDFFIKSITSIYKDCKPYLKDLHSKLPYGEHLYSGRKSRGAMFIERSVRKDRQSTDTHKEIHDDFDRTFQYEYGWKGRSNSLFCSGDMSDAEEYGTLFMIFPQGQYKVAYHPEIGDLYIHFSRQIQGGGVGVSKKNRINGLKAQFFRDIGGGDTRDIDDDFAEYFDEVTVEGGGHGYYVYEDEDEFIEIPSKIKDDKAAKKYVQSKMIDPMDYDQFSLVWHPEMDYDKFYYQFFEKWRDNRDKKHWDEAQIKYDEWMQDVVEGYEINKLKDAIISGNEIMLNCKKFYGLDARQQQWNFDGYFRKFGVKGHKTEEELAEWWAKDMKKL